MSTLIEETPEHLILTAYVHGSNENFSEWEFDEKGEYAYPEYIQEAEHYALYELLIRYKIDKKTGQVTYLNVTG